MTSVVQPLSSSQKKDNGDRELCANLIVICQFFITIKHFEASLQRRCSTQMSSLDFESAFFYSAHFGNNNWAVHPISLGYLQHHSYYRFDTIFIALTYSPTSQIGSTHKKELNKGSQIILCSMKKSSNYYGVCSNGLAALRLRIMIIKSGIIFTHLKLVELSSWMSRQDIWKSRVKCV